MNEALSQLSHYHREERPWGSFEQFTHNEQTTVKRIVVKAGEAFSLQKHTKRSEFYYVFAGEGFITVGTDRREVRAGDSFFIPAGELHRAEATDDSDLTFLEIAFGDFDESDITRLEDKYGRNA